MKKKLITLFAAIMVAIGIAVLIPAPAHAGVVLTCNDNETYCETYATTPEGNDGVTELKMKTTWLEEGRVVSIIGQLRDLCPDGAGYKAWAQFRAYNNSNEHVVVRKQSLTAFCNNAGFDFENRLNPEGIGKIHRLEVLVQEYRFTDGYYAYKDALRFAIDNPYHS